MPRCAPSPRATAQVIGRAQARFSPMGGGPLLAELMNAPLFAQLRYVGPADTLWRLSGTETLDLSGPIAVGADIGGRLADPAIRGSLRTQSARLESPVTGMVIDQVQSQARFSGPQLIFTQISGRTAGGGSVSGTGSATFSGGRTALNLSFQANQALLLNRDDIAARVTGPLQIRSDGQGGTISGDLRLDKGRFQLGRASAAASVPQLHVRDRGRRSRRRDSRSRTSTRGNSPSSSPAATSRSLASASTAAGRPTSTSAALPMRRALPAAPTSSAATMISPGATSSSIAA